MKVIPLLRSLLFLQNNDKYVLSIENGHIKGSDDTTGKFRVSNQLYAVANALGEGYKFSCWKVGDAIVGFETTYAFRMSSKDMTLTAVYVAVDVDVEVGRTSFVSIQSFPDGCQMLKAGIVVQKTDVLNGVTLKEENVRFVRFTGTSKNSYSSFKYT